MKHANMTGKKQCEYCHQNFSTRFFRQRFCRLDCANLFQKSLYSQQLNSCLFCKKTFKKQYETHKFCCLTCSSRASGHSNRRNVILPDVKDSRLAELLGIMAGDGNFGPRFFVITLNAKADNDYAIFVWNLAKALFPGATVTINFRSQCNVHRVQISSIMVVEFLKKIWPHRKEIPQHIFANKEFRLNFVRGLIDTEGTISYKIYKGKDKITVYKQLAFTNFNKKYRKIVHDVLKENGFKPTKPARNIYISNKRDIKMYFQKIGSHNSKMHVKNSIETYQHYIEYKDRMARINELFEHFRKHGNFGGVPEPG